jgi:hypothetical protein
LIHLASDHPHPGFAVARVHGEIDSTVTVVYLESSGVMFPGKNPAAGKEGKDRPGIPTRDKDTLDRRTIGVSPFDGNTVGGIFAGHPEGTREPEWAHPFQPDETDSDDGVAAVELRTKWSGKEALDQSGVGAKINENPPLNHTLNHGEMHHWF